MAAPVTTAGSFTCTHGGTRTLTSTTKLTVRGQPVLLFTAASAGAPYTGCGFVVGGVNKPCQTTTATSGAATALTVGGAAVLLDNLVATTENPPPPPPAPQTVVVAAGQTTLTAS